MVSSRKPRFFLQVPDLRRAVVVTLLLLAVYQLGLNIPIPGVNQIALKAAQAEQQAQPSLLVNTLDLLSGGAASQFSILALGIQPYLAAAGLVQALGVIFWKRRMEEDPREARRFMAHWTLLLTVPIGLLQAYGQVRVLTLQECSLNFAILPRFGFSASNWLYTLATLVVMTGGTMFAVWLAGLISEFGIRNQGMALVIFSGVALELSGALRDSIQGDPGQWLKLAITLGVLILAIFGTIYILLGRRNVSVMYPGRRLGNRMSMPIMGSIPIMVNFVGVQPLLAGQSLFLLPATVASLMKCSSAAWAQSVSSAVLNFYSGENPYYWILLFLLVVTFTFFLTDVTFAEQNYGENLKKSGAQIPGVARGAPTERYLRHILARITLPSAVFLGLLVISPYLSTLILGLSIPFLAGESIYILTSTTRDVSMNMEAEMRLRGYDAALIR